jgi:hypothetical protein
MILTFLLLQNICCLLLPMGMLSQLCLITSSVFSDDLTDGHLLKAKGVIPGGQPKEQEETPTGLAF